jgi:putative peptidoglycan binding protein
VRRPCLAARVIKIWLLSSSRRRTGIHSLFLIAAVLLGCCGLDAIVPFTATASASSPFRGTALWVAQVPPQAAPAALAGEAAAVGAHTLFVKAAEGSTSEPQFSATLVAGLRGAGISVCGWTFVYGANPLGEAAAAVAAVRNGAQCLVIDAEGPYDKRYGAAQLFVRSLRSQLGPRFPLALAGQAEVLQHPTFPYSVFLGPGGVDFNLPQIYWLDLGAGLENAYAATIGGNSIYARPVAPVGQLYGSPAPGELIRFRALAFAYGSVGMSFFDLDSAQPQELASLAAPFAPLARRAVVAPTLHAGADGDVVLWAQELLDAAGARLPVGGFFGAQTARALARFQERHHLPADGVLRPASWKALLRFHPRAPSWAAHGPDSAR